MLQIIHNKSVFHPKYQPMFHHYLNIFLNKTVMLAYCCWHNFNCLNLVYFMTLLLRSEQKIVDF